MRRTFMAWLLCGSLFCIYEFALAIRSGFTSSSEDVHFLIVYFVLVMLFYFVAGVFGLLLGRCLVWTYNAIRKKNAEIDSAFFPTSMILVCWTFLHSVNWLDETHPSIQIFSILGMGICTALFFLSVLFCFGATLFAKRLAGIRTGSRPGKISLAIMMILSGGLALGATAFLDGRHENQTARTDTSPPPDFNVVLIVVDTLREDRWDPGNAVDFLGPDLDQIREHSVQFTQAICQIPSTGPSIASIMTSLYPRTHGAIANGHPLKASWNTLAEQMKLQGYQTSAFVSSIALEPKICGLDQGFDRYVLSYLPFAKYLFSKRLFGASFIEKFMVRIRKSYETVATQTSQCVFKWLSRYGDTPFFLWVHYWDPHEDYAPPPPYDSIMDKDYHGIVNGTIEQNNAFNAGRIHFSPNDLLHLNALYDGEVAFASRQVGQIIHRLDTLGLLEKTLVVITADHGESLGEHKFIGHGHVLYDQTVRVPLILYCPRLLPEGLIVRKQVQSIDITPTILDLLGLPLPDETQGDSLVPLIHQPKQQWKEEAYGERRYYEGLAEDVSFIRTPEWKYIVSSQGDEWLYNLITDPGERENSADRYASQRIYFRNQLAQWEKKIPSSKDSLTMKKVDKEAREKLKALGYIN